MNKSFITLTGMTSFGIIFVIYKGLFLRPVVFADGLFMGFLLGGYLVTCIAKYAIRQFKVIKK